nr:ElyC/SanA/YdcF family protein [Streptomyces alkaliterrae]
MGRRRFAQVLMLLCVLALLPTTWIRLSTDGRVGPAAAAPHAPVAMVFGAGLRDGEPSRYLASRLDTAADLYHGGKVRALLLTGDNSRADYDEPTAMRDHLLRRGVPADRVVLDYAGFDTWASCSRAKRVFGVDEALLVSQAFHVPRAVALCDAAGVRAHGVAVAEARNAVWYAGHLRELAAGVKAGLEATFTPDPRFLGPQEPGIARALSAD